MVQSSEYPDLAWFPPRSWTNANRTSVQLIVIHDTEGAEVATSAEDGAHYDQTRVDGTSTHYFHDSNSTVQCVRTEDIAHAARPQGNLRGIQHELCGKAAQGAAGWADAASEGTLRQAARQVARDCHKWNIPVRRLTVGQVADGLAGICGHADITIAFPQDHGTHTDPGPTFPWGLFITMARNELESMDMPSVQDVLNGIGSDLLNDDSNISKGTRRQVGIEIAHDLGIDTSGVTTGVRKQVNAVTDPRFDDMEDRFDAVEIALAEIKAVLAELKPTTP